MGYAWEDEQSLSQRAQICLLCMVRIWQALYEADDSNSSKIMGEGNRLSSARCIKFS